jgi:hypothetical protein
MCRCLAGHTEAARASFTDTATLDRAVVLVTTINCGAIALGARQHNVSILRCTDFAPMWFMAGCTLSTMGRRAGAMVGDTGAVRIYS